MLADLIDRYAWTEEDLDLAWTVAVIEGRTSDEVIRIYGGDPTRAVGDYTFAQMWDLQGGDPYDLKFHVQVLTHGRYVMAIENNGWTGDMPEIGRRCSSEDGRFFSVYWSSNAVHRILEAIDGKVAAYFELRDGADPYNEGDLAPSWITDGVVVELEKLRATAMALMEQQTGLAFDRHWLNDSRPTYRIPDPDWMLRDVENARLP